MVLGFTPMRRAMVYPTQPVITLKVNSRNARWNRPEVSSSRPRYWKSLRFGWASHLAARFFAGLLGVASGDLFVPCGVKGRGPGFAYGAANHRLESAGFADRTQVDVDKDTAEHDEGGNVVDDVADGNGDSPESSRARPQDDASDQVDDAAADNLPELDFLSGVEEAGIGRIHFFFAAGDLLYFAHPARIGGSPDHGLEPVQGLQSEEEDEAHSEPRMHNAAEW